MTWNDSINCYLLKCVKSYGKNWSEVRKSLKVLIYYYLRDEPKKDFTEQELSIQYKYLIASAIPTDTTGSLQEEELLDIALADYSQRRLRLIDERVQELNRLEERYEKDNKLLKEGRYSEISEESLLTFRKRLRAHGKADVIGEVLNLEPLPPNPEEDQKFRKEYRRGKMTEKGIHRGVFDDEGNLWIPVFSEDQARDFFLSRSGDQSPDRVDDTVRDVEMKEQGDASSPIPPPRKIPKIEPKQPLQAIGIPRRALSVSAVKRPLTVTVGGPSVLTKLSVPSSIDFEDSSATPRPQKRTTVVKVEHPTTSSRTLNRSRSRVPPQVSDVLLAPNPSPLGRRRWRRDLQSLLSGANSHRHAHIFNHPVTDEIAPNYSLMIHSPMDLSTLKRMLDARLGEIYAASAGLIGGPVEDGTVVGGGSPIVVQQTVLSIVKQVLHDLLLMFANARMYNNRDHSVHHVAGSMCADVLTDLLLPYLSKE
ncbi:hypothetical protein Aperf_G00000100129 [Anoplocephala perfoliata]